MAKTDDTIQVLLFMGINRDDLRRDAYQHWLKFINFCRDNSGRDWDSVRLRLRSWIGVDFRYLDAYLSTSCDWGIICEKHGKLVYVGIPDNNSEESATEFMKRKEKEKAEKGDKK